MPVSITPPKLQKLESEQPKIWGQGEGFTGFVEMGVEGECAARATYKTKGRNNGRGGWCVKQERGQKRE